MDRTQLVTLAKLRAVVGYLGERDQYGWWQSAFFAPGSRSFLAPVFGRTALLAQCAGVTRAAAVIHDERIGVGRVYHLFRLPEDVEQGIHRVLHDPEVGRSVLTLVASRDAALAFLRQAAGADGGGGVGPTRVGSTDALRDSGHWRRVAALYGRACGQDAEVYPYFADRA